MSGPGGGRLERSASAVLPELLGVLAFAVSFRHVRHVLRDHGADEVSSWALTVGVEALAITSLLEKRRRQRFNAEMAAAGDPRRQSTTWPTCVLLVGVALTVACNLETARDGGWGVLVALLGPGLYLLAFSLVATRAASHTPVPARSAHPDGLHRRPPAADDHHAARTADDHRAPATDDHARPGRSTPADDHLPSMRTITPTRDDQRADDHTPPARTITLTRDDHQADDHTRPGRSATGDDLSRRADGPRRDDLASAARTAAADAPRLRTSTPAASPARPARRPVLTERQSELLPSVRPAAHTLAAAGRPVTRDTLRIELAARGGVSVGNADLGPIAKVLAAEPLPTPRAGTA